MSDPPEEKPRASYPRRRTPRPRNSDLTGPARVRRELLGRRRLGQGELAQPELIQDMARLWFFEAIHEVRPRVYASLEEQVFPPYRSFFQEATGITEAEKAGDESLVAQALSRFASFCMALPGPPPIRSLFGWAMLCAAEALHSTLPPLKKALEACGRSFNLTDIWCLDVALCTLLQLQVNELMGLPENQRPSKFMHPALRLPPPVPLPPSTKGPGDAAPTPGIHLISMPQDAPYNPYEETRAEAKVRLLPILGREKIKDYLDQVETACEGAERVRQRSQRHFRRLALYQCGEDSRRDLAKAEPANLSTVAAPIAELARLLGLTLKPDSRGRPPDVKEKGPRHRAR